MQKIFGLLVIYLLWLPAGNATIWLGGVDNFTNTRAMIGSSSGPIGNQRTVWATYYSHFYKRGKAIVTFGGYGVYSEGNKAVLEVLETSQDAESLVREIYNHPDVRKNVRITALSSENNSVASLIGNGGCHGSNEYCGEQIGENFVIAGGGLENASVIADAYDFFTNQSNGNKKLVCKLYSSLKRSYQSGGEKKTFNNLVIIIDDPNKEDVIEILIKRGSNDESFLLKEIREKLKVYGYFC